MSNRQLHQPDELPALRHSAAHLLAAAVLELWPDTKPTIGPATDDGFYYDFEFNQEVGESDFAQIENKMAELVKKWDEFSGWEVSASEAQQLFANNKYKLELIAEITARQEPITLYKCGDFTDLCKGGHILSPKANLHFFKLLSVAGAYWRGDANNKMLTRIYGTAFFSQPELDAYLDKREAAKELDHKKIGKDLDLFVFSDTVGKGLPLWTAKGATIRRELERFIVDEELKRGYQHVYTPDIASLELYKKSGHYPYYKDSMYAPIVIDDEEFMLRPMTCPHHFELYLSKPHSYKELPIRYAELAKLYRYEQSGELNGLLRVRSFCLADAHIVCRPHQAADELDKVLDLIEYIASIFGLQMGEDYHYRLSLGNRADDSKYFKDDAAWDKAENELRTVLKNRQVSFVEAADEAAFYGPKIDVQMKNIHGKEDTAFTVQYDFVMPKRFNLEYVNEQGGMEQAIVIHRSSIGAIERSMAFLIEKFAGKFPLWLAPEQVRVLPIADRHIEFAQQVQVTLQQAGIRVQIDSRSERLGAKIRDAQHDKLPYIAVIGDNEVANQQLAVRERDGKDSENKNVDEFMALLQAEIANKSF